MSLPSGDDPDTALFVYGTLQPGGPNAHVLAPLGGEWHPGAVFGALQARGWGAALGYPALVPDAAGAPVRGQVLCSDELPPQWAMLDEFEGDEYQREAVTVQLDAGGVMRAYTYVLRDAPQ